MKYISIDCDNGSDNWEGVAEFWRDDDDKVNCLIRDTFNTPDKKAKSFTIELEDLKIIYDAFKQYYANDKH